jgi:hypothetical protein
MREQAQTQIPERVPMGAMVDDVCAIGRHLPGDGRAQGKLRRPYEPVSPRSGSGIDRAFGEGHRTFLNPQDVGVSLVEDT